MHEKYDLFIEMTRNLNLSKTADRLDVQQPWLSKVLKNIERDVGYDLFIRKKTGLELTPAGSRLKELILEAKVGWASALRSDIKEQIGELTVISHNVLGSVFFPMVYSVVVEKYPKIQLDFEFLRSPEAVRRVLNFEADFAFVANPSLFGDLVVVPLFKEPVCFYARSTSLKDQDILFNPEMIQIGKLLKDYKKCKCTPVSDYDIIASMASQSNAKALLPALVAARYPGLKKVSENLMLAEISLIYRKEKQWTAGRKDFTKWLVSQIKQKSQLL